MNFTFACKFEDRTFVKNTDQNGNDQQSENEGGQGLPYEEDTVQKSIGLTPFFVEADSC